jgi:hypothetical protein
MAEVSQAAMVHEQALAEDVAQDLSSYPRVVEATV